MYRVTYCARTSPLPLLPSGPGGFGGIAPRRARHIGNDSIQPLCLRPAAAYSIDGPRYPLPLSFYTFETHSFHTAYPLYFLNPFIMKGLPVTPRNQNI